MVRRSSLVEWAPRVLLGLCVAFFAALKVYAFGHADSDENIYFYMAVRTSFDGLEPYRDYFFAHPPLHLYLAVAAFKLVAFIEGLLTGNPAAGVAMMTAPEAWADGGFALAVGKSIGVIAGATAALFVYRAARRLGALEAVIAAGCFLFAPDVLASCFTGTMEAVMFLAIAVERVVAGRDRQAALAFSAATLVALYAAPAGLAVFAVLLLIAPRRAFTLALSTGACLVLVHGGLLLWAGRGYFDAVFAYHFVKPEGANRISEGLAILIRHDTALALGVPLALAAAWLERQGLRREPLGGPREDARSQLLTFAVTAVIATLLVLAAGKAFFGFYLLTIAGFCAVLAGYGYAAIVRASLAAVRSWRERTNPRRRVLALATLVMLAIGGEAFAGSTWLRRREIPDERVGTVIAHAWQRARALGAFDGAVRALFFRPQQRLGERATGITRFLWSTTCEPFDFVTLASVNVRRAIPAQGTLLGESTVVPLLALASGRRLALDEADTNDMRFRSGITAPEAFVERLRREPPDAAVFGLGDPVPHLEPFASWLAAEYDAQLVEVRGTVYALHTRKGRPPLVPDLPPRRFEPQATRPR